MSEVTIYTTRYCPFCIHAKQLLDDKGAKYTEIPVDNNHALRVEMMQKSGRRTVPQIWVGNQHVGGCDELFMLDRQGLLDNLLNPATSV